MTQPMAVMIDKITAPWSEEQVAVLNRMQADPRAHGYTCPGKRAACAGLDRMRVLRAFSTGWVCRCGHYKQDWAVITTHL